MTTLEALDQKVTALHEMVSRLTDRHLTRHEMAQRFAVSPATIDRWARNGQLPPSVNGRWLLSDVQKWEQKR